MPVGFASAFQPNFPPHRAGQPHAQPQNKLLFGAWRDNLPDYARKPIEEFDTVIKATVAGGNIFQDYQDIVNTAATAAKQLLQADRITDGLDQAFRVDFDGKQLSRSELSSRLAGVRYDFDQAVMPVDVKEKMRSGFFAYLKEQREIPQPQLLQALTIVMDEPKVLPELVKPQLKQALIPLLLETYDPKPGSSMLCTAKAFEMARIHPDALPKSSQPEMAKKMERAFIDRYQNNAPTEQRLILLTAYGLLPRELKTLDGKREAENRVASLQAPDEIKKTLIRLIRSGTTH